MAVRRILIALTGLAALAGTTISTAATAGAATSHLTASASSSAKAAKPCGLLTKSTISHVVGKTAKTGQPSTLVFYPGQKVCTWDMTTPNTSLTITYEPKVTEANLTKTNGELGGQAHRIKGVGTVAYLICFEAQSGITPQCEMRAFGKGTTFSFVLAGTGTDQVMAKQIETIGKKVYANL